MHAAVPKSQFTGSTSEALFELAASKRRKITLRTKSLLSHHSYSFTFQIQKDTTSAEVCAYGFSKATNSGEGGFFITLAYAEKFSWFCFEDVGEHRYQLNATYVLKSQIQSSGCLHIIHIASIFSRNRFFFFC